MNVPKHEWRVLADKYIEGLCTTEESACWERLILSDDEAMLLHMEAVADAEITMPELADPDGFADRVLTRDEIVPYPVPNTPPSIKRPRRWYEKTIFHYTVAASITLVFMFTGAFERIFPEAIERIYPGPQTPSYTEQLMNKTTGWLDQLLP